MVLQAIGGSTNGLIHLTAIANRTAHRHRSRSLRQARPRGAGAGRPEAVGRALHGAFPSCRRRAEADGAARRSASISTPRPSTGETLRDVVAGAEEVPGQDAIRPRNNPIKPEGAMAVLHGNLAPRGAVIKHSAASPKLLQHTGRAVVFESVEDMTLRVDDPDARRHRRRRAGAAQRRAEGRAGHAGGRLSADPEEARRAPASRTWCGFRMRG